MRALALVAVFVLALALFAGCGARVTTVMTVGDNFSGTREIKLTIDADDMSKVTGGIEALKGVIDANLPADLTYVVTDDTMIEEETPEEEATPEEETPEAETPETEVPEEAVPEETPVASQYYITFTLAFSDLEDYQAKVARLIALDPETEIEPVVTYEKNETPFKTGLKFQENFRSFDLLVWLFNALQESGIITETDTSDWYELGSDEVIIDGNTYSAYSHKFEVDEQTRNCLNSGRVETTLLPDGTIQRVITLVANASTVTALDEKIGSLKDYMAKLAGDGITFEEKETEYGDMEYSFSFSSKSTEDVVAKTNRVLQSEKNTLTLTLAAKEGAFGVATVNLSETLDGSYYFNYDSALYSYYTLYPNAKKVEGNAYYGDAENKFNYNPTDGQLNEFVCEWLVNYKTVDVEVEAQNLETIDISLIFALDETLPADVQAVALSALESAAKDKGEFEKDGVKATVTFSGAPADVASKVNAFVAAYVPADENAEGDEKPTYCSIELHELGTSSKFTDGVYGNVVINLMPILGECTVNLHNKEGMTETNIVGGYAEDGEGNLTSGSDVALYFTTVRMNWLMIILTAVAGLLLVAGVVIGLRCRQDFKTFIVFQKKPAPVAAPVQYADPNQYAQPVQYADPNPYAQPVQYADPNQYAQPVQYADPNQYAQPVQYAAPVEEAPVEYAAPVAEQEEEEEIL